MEPSLREAIEEARKAVGEQLTHYHEDCLSIILSAAESWADHIDNEDPEGMQDRNCGTCKHHDADWVNEACKKCMATDYDTPGWEPK